MTFQRFACSILLVLGFSIVGYAKSDIAAKIIPPVIREPAQNVTFEQLKNKVLAGMYSVSYLELIDISIAKDNSTSPEFVQAQLNCYKKAYRKSFYENASAGIRACCDEYKAFPKAQSTCLGHLASFNEQPSTK